MVLCMLWTMQAKAAVWYVDKYNQNSTKDGTTWLKAFNTIQEGIDAAFNAGGGEVWVRAAIYSEARTGIDPGTSVDCGSLMLKDGVPVYGGFAGHETARGQRDWVRFETTIDGATSRGGQPAYHVVQASKTSVLDGFTVTGGHADDGAENSQREDNGAAVLCNRYPGQGAISPSFAHCIFRDNVASENGGAVHLLETFVLGESSATFDDCTFVRNRAKEGAGIGSIGSRPILTNCSFLENTRMAVYVQGAFLTATDCTFSGNFSGSGGGILAYTGAELEGCTFVSNVAAYDTDSMSGSFSVGGACMLHSNATTVTVTRCRFVGNIADRGGAIHIYSGTPAITECVFLDNRGEDGGGAISIEEGAGATISRSLFQGNYGYRRGGAIQVGWLNSVANATVTNCTFLGNDGGQIGGALYAINANLTVRNCTLWENFADDGGGIFLTSMVSFTLNNSIVRGNSTGQLTDDSPGVSTYTYNNVEGGIAGTGNVNTAVTFEDEPGGDLRLTSGSAGVNSGTNTGAPATDIRGVARPQGGTVDMGAFEYTSAAVQAAATVSPGQVGLPLGERVQLDYTPQARSAADAVSYAPPTPALLRLRQPDGTAFEGWIRGSEHLSWVETPEGWRVMLNADSGYYEYMTLDANSEVTPSGVPVGRRDPRRAGIVQDADTLQRAIEAQLAREPESRRAEVFAELHKTPTSGTVKSLVILVNYTDTSTTYTQADFNGLFNTVGYTGHGSNGSVRDYYLETSYGALDFQFTVTGWFTLSNASSYYDEANTTTRQQMITEALALLDASGFDFSTMDGDSDGWIDNLVVLHQGAGQEAGGPFMWSHTSSIPVQTYDGKSLEVYCTVPELYSGGLGTIGVIVHEMGHTFGLPDLYDLDNSSPGVGQWDLMGLGTWNNSGITPAHFSAWCKDFLGWLSPAVLSANQTGVSMPGVEGTATVYRIDHGMAPGEYLLIENRRQTGFDSALEQPGLLVWRADEKADNNMNDLRRAVDVLGADESIAPDTNSAGNPFPGTSNNRALNGSSTPSTDSNLWGDTGISISNISNAGATMTFDLALESAGGAGTRTVFLGDTGTGPLSVSAIAASPSAAWLTVSPGAPLTIGPAGVPALLTLTPNLTIAPKTRTEVDLQVTSNAVSKAVTSVPLVLDNLSDTAVIGVSDSISPAADRDLPYSNTAAGSIASATVTVSNTGSTALTIASLSIEGTNAGEFQVYNPPTLPASVNPAGTQALTVRFRPRTPGTHTAVLVIANNSSALPAATVVLKGTAPADADLDGVIDANEPAGDADNDTIVNSLDWDSDNDGFSDGVEAAAGTNALSAASKPVLPTVYVDFGYSGVEMLTDDFPANTLAEGTAAVAASGTVKIKGNSSVTHTLETPVISKAMRVEALLGPVTIGGAAKAGHPLADLQPGENIVLLLVVEALQ